MPRFCSTAYLPPLVPSCQMVWPPMDALSGRWGESGAPHGPVSSHCSPCTLSGWGAESGAPHGHPN